MCIRDRPIDHADHCSTSVRLGPTLADPTHRFAVRTIHESPLERNATDYRRGAQEAYLGWPSSSLDQASSAGRSLKIVRRSLRVTSPTAANQKIEVEKTLAIKKFAWRWNQFE